MKQILIIEDDIFLGDVLLQKLKSSGFGAELARDGRAGLAAMRERRPDLILLDIILPLVNGYEVLEEKQKDEKIRGIPVIVISNSGQPVEINRALSLGVRDYLVKAQFDPEDVIAKVRMQLGEEKPASIAKKDEKGGTGSAETTLKKETGLAGKKIMWVEDDSFLSDLIARKLSSFGATLLHAENGEAAEKVLEREEPDIILLDIVLPGKSGYEVLKSIKANPKQKHIPVILLSNLGQREEVEKGKLLGAARFLIKATVTLDEIVEEVKAVLRGLQK